MKISRIVWFLLVIIILGGGWYLMTSHQQGIPPAPVVTTPTSTVEATVPTTTTAPTPATSNVIKPGTSAAIIVGDNLMLGTNASTKLGTYLIGYTGMTVYTFGKDSVGNSTCYGSCAQIWLPYVVSANDRYNIKAGGDATKAGVITRTDGTLQLTYNGLPQYFYGGDKASGDTNGEGINNLWHATKP